MMNFECEMSITEKFDDPVGNWYLCSDCKVKVFSPALNNEGNKCYLKWCPNCGSEVIKINKLPINVL